MTWRADCPSLDRARRFQYTYADPIANGSLLSPSRDLVVPASRATATSLKDARLLSTAIVSTSTAYSREYGSCPLKRLALTSTSPVLPCGVTKRND